MTEAFGPCGIGWRYEINEPSFRQDGEIVMVFVRVDVFVKVDGEWSYAIPGYGGSRVVDIEKGRAVADDEGVKMAVTDALGTAMKALGVAADIYRGQPDGKYMEREMKPTKSAPSQQKKTEEPPKTEEEQLEAGKQKFLDGEELTDKAVEQFAAKEDNLTKETKNAVIALLDSKGVTAEGSSGERGTRAAIASWASSGRVFDISALYESEALEILRQAESKKVA